MSYMSGCRHRRYAPSSKFGNYFYFEAFIFMILSTFFNLLSQFVENAWLELQ